LLTSLGDMFLKKKIQQNLIQALKQKRELEVSVLRLLLAAINNQEIAQNKPEQGLSKQEIEQVIARQIKQRRDSIAGYKQGGRIDLAQKEEQELAILQKYLPPQLSADEIKKVAQTVIASGLSDFGSIMGQTMAKLKGRAHGNLVKRIVEQMIN